MGAYLLVSYRDYVDQAWTTEFYDHTGPGSVVAARARAESLSEAFSEVRFLGADMIARWGPTDPGGPFAASGRKRE